MFNDQNELPLIINEAATKNVLALKVSGENLASLELVLPAYQDMLNATRVILFVEENDAREKLRKVLQQVETLLLDTQDLEYEILGTDWENETLKNSIWKNVHPYPRNLTEGAHSMEIVDVIGRVGALSPADSKDVFVADLDPLFGVEIEIGEFPTEDLLVQDALF